VNLKVPVLPLAAAIERLKVLLPVLAGPGHALEVHEVTVCPTPVSFVHVTDVPTATVADSGWKQKSVPPPEHAPDVIVIVVAAVAVPAMAVPTKTNPANAPNKVSTMRVAPERLRAPTPATALVLGAQSAVSERPP
jgi:hypothetical protein